MKGVLVCITSLTCGACQNMKKAGHYDELQKLNTEYNKELSKNNNSLETVTIELAKNGDTLTPAQLNNYCAWYPIFMFFKEEDWSRLKSDPKYFPEIKVFNGEMEMIDGKVRVKPSPAERRQPQTGNNIHQWIRSQYAPQYVAKSITPAGFSSSSESFNPVGRFYDIKAGDEIPSTCSRKNYIAKNRNTTKHNASK